MYKHVPTSILIQLFLAHSETSRLYKMMNEINDDFCRIKNILTYEKKPGTNNHLERTENFTDVEQEYSAERNPNIYMNCNQDQNNLWSSSISDDQSSDVEHECLQNQTSGELRGVLENEDKLRFFISGNIQLDINSQQGTHQLN